MSASDPSARRPVRVQRRRTRGWRTPPGAVYVGRPTRWGNPYVIGETSELHPGGPLTRADAVALFRDHLYGPVPSREEQEREIRAALRGRDLMCWCPLDGPCHADVLLEIANR
jgi:hypothetical protein